MYTFFISTTSLFVGHLLQTRASLCHARTKYDAFFLNAWWNWYKTSVSWNVYLFYQKISWWHLNFFPWNNSVKPCTYTLKLKLGLNCIQSKPEVFFFFQERTGTWLIVFNFYVLRTPRPISGGYLSLKPHPQKIEQGWTLNPDLQVSNNFLITDCLRKKIRPSVTKRVKNALLSSTMLYICHWPKLKQYAKGSGEWI